MRRLLRGSVVDFQGEFSCGDRVAKTVSEISQKINTVFCMLSGPKVSTIKDIRILKDDLSFNKYGI